MNEQRKQFERQVFYVEKELSRCGDTKTHRLYINDNAPFRVTPKVMSEACRRFRVSQVKYHKRYVKIFNR